MNGFSQINKAVKVLAKNNPMVLRTPQIPETAVPGFSNEEPGMPPHGDYYSITMLTMLSFTSLMIGSICFIGERQDNHQAAEKAPVSQVSCFAKILA